MRLTRTDIETQRERQTDRQTALAGYAIGKVWPAELIN